MDSYSQVLDMIQGMDCAECDEISAASEALMNLFTQLEQKVMDADCEECDHHDDDVVEIFYTWDDYWGDFMENDGEPTEEFRDHWDDYLEQKGETYDSLGEYWDAWDEWYDDYYDDDWWTAYWDDLYASWGY